MLTISGSSNDGLLFLPPLFRDPPEKTSRKFVFIQYYLVQYYLHLVIPKSYNANAMIKTRQFWLKLIEDSWRKRSVLWQSLRPRSLFM